MRFYWGTIRVPELVRPRGESSPVFSIRMAHRSVNSAKASIMVLQKWGKLLRSSEVLMRYHFLTHAGPNEFAPQSLEAEKVFESPLVQVKKFGGDDGRMMRSLTNSRLQANPRTHRCLLSIQCCGQ